MVNPVALVLLFATPPDQTTLPRHPDPDPVTRQSTRDGAPGVDVVTLRIEPLNQKIV